MASNTTSIISTAGFHLHGQYSAQEADSQMIEITYGYSKEQRPDLKQVVLNLITGHLSQLPVWMEALSGNSSDKDSFPKTVQAFCEQMKAGREVYWVVDSALYSAANLQALGETRWLTRVPETLAEAKRLLAETDLSQMTPLADDYAYFECPSNYGQIAQRWLVVYSPAAAQREEKTLQCQVEKEAVAAQKAWRMLAGQTFNCQEDAQEALAAFQKRWQYHRARAVATPLTRYPGPGRPAEGATPAVVGYRLQGVVSLSETALETARRSLGRFVLATNELEPEKLPPESMLSQYKAQGVSVERGFRFLKDPLFFADSLFLKNPGRIMALIMIMVLALLVYALAERKLRLRLVEVGQSVPNQVRKETQTPTMRWIFQLFEGIDLLIVWQNGIVLNRQVLNLRPLHRAVLHVLGPPVENCYLLTS
ncbi:MAG: IS1634 family transposase [Chloroflexota bacterium]